MGGQGWPTPIHTQRPTHPPFQHRHLLKKVLKRLFSRFSTRAHIRTDRPMDGRTDQWMDLPTNQLTNGRTGRPTDGPMDGRMDKASYRVVCPQLKTTKKKNINYSCSLFCSSLMEYCFKRDDEQQYFNASILNRELEWKLDGCRFGMMEKIRPFCTTLENCIHQVIQKWDKETQESREAKDEDEDEQERLNREKGP